MRPDTKALYPPDWEDISRLVRDRANRICQKCKRTPERHGIVLTTHHKDYNPANNDLSNLVCLCQGCHLRQHGRDLAQATKYGKIDKLVKMGQLVFPNMELPREEHLTRVIEGKALTSQATHGRYAHPGT